MANEKSFPFDAVENSLGEADRLYYAEDFANYFKNFIGNGIFPNPSNNLKVESLHNNMIVSVAVGSAFINGYGYVNKEKLDIAITTASSAYNRKDIIVLQLSLVDREIKIIYKEGTATANPIKPTLVRNADVYELQLAEVFVKSGAAQITEADITDTRLNSSVCGIVAAVVENVDTTSLFNQYESYLNAKIKEWNETKAQQTIDFNKQLQAQQTEFNSFKSSAEGWLNGAKLDISNLQKFDFDNFIYFKGYTYKVINAGNIITEQIVNNSNQDIFATRVNTNSNGNWIVQTKCPSLNIDTTITYSEENNN